MVMGRWCIQVEEGFPYPVRRKILHQDCCDMYVASRKRAEYCTAAGDEHGDGRVYTGPVLSLSPRLTMHYDKYSTSQEDAEDAKVVRTSPRRCEESQTSNARI